LFVLSSFLLLPDFLANKDIQLTYFFVFMAILLFSLLFFCVKFLSITLLLQLKNQFIYNKMLSYRRETALQGAL